MIRWLAEASIPFDTAMSKNNSVRHGKGFTYTPKSHKDLRDAFVMLLKSKLRGVSFVKGKVWVDIFVEKPDNRSDAANYVDFVCDGVKKAIEIDDRWYSLVVDWDIKKVDPHIRVRIGQEVA